MAPKAINADLRISYFGQIASCSFNNWPVVTFGLKWLVYCKRNIDSDW